MTSDGLSLERQLPEKAVMKPLAVEEGGTAPEVGYESRITVSGHRRLRRARARLHG